MNRFSIDNTALAEIRLVFDRSGLGDPVARLYERADPGDLFDELRSEMRKGEKIDRELAAIGNRRFAEVGEQLQSTLAVGACERSDYQAQDLCEVDGITFAMSLEIVALLSEYRLVFEHDRFLLRGLDNTPHTLRSIAKSMSHR